MPVKQIFRRISALITAGALGTALSLTAIQPAQAADPHVYILQNSKLCMDGTNCEPFKMSAKSSKRAPKMTARLGGGNCTVKPADGFKRGQTSIAWAQAWNPPKGSDPNKLYPVKLRCATFPAVNGWRIKTFENCPGKSNDSTFWAKSTSKAYTIFTRTPGCRMTFKVTKISKANSVGFRSTTSKANSVAFKSTKVNKANSIAFKSGKVNKANSI